MEKYIIEYNDYDEILLLLGKEIPHSNLVNVNTVIIDLYEDEFNSIKEAGYTIIKNHKGELLHSPTNFPNFRSYPTLPSYIDDFLHISQSKVAGFDGTGVSIALLDTGCQDSNRDLANPTLIRQDYTGLGVTDNYAHGSKACMIISQKYSFFDTSSEVQTGLAYGCQLYSMNVYDGGAAAMITAIDYCITNSIDIINISLDMGYGLTNAINSAINAGIIVVCASGNLTGSYIAHPADVPGVICVNGVNYNDYNNPYGSYLMPGGETQVTAVIHGSGHYEFFAGGTSQAAFHLSALMAIYKQKYPSLNTPKAINLLRKKCTQMPGYTYNVTSSTNGVLLNYKTGAGFISSIN